jgi:hypothetical protein
MEPLCASTATHSATVADQSPAHRPQANLGAPSIPGIERVLRRPMRGQSPQDKRDEQDKAHHNGPKRQFHQEQLTRWLAPPENAAPHGRWWPLHAARSSLDALRSHPVSNAKRRPKPLQANYSSCHACTLFLHQPSTIKPLPGLTPAQACAKGHALYVANSQAGWQQRFLLWRMTLPSLCDDERSSRFARAPFGPAGNFAGHPRNQSCRCRKPNLEAAAPGDTAVPTSGT